MSEVQDDAEVPCPYSPDCTTEHPCGDCREYERYCIEEAAERAKPRIFKNKRTGDEQHCRLEPATLDAFYDDPMTEYSGCGGEFVEDWRNKDLSDGCPWCCEDAVNNPPEEP